MIENDSSLFKIDIENYSGPLETLLDLAKAQKVNLEEISITKLADQFHNFITNKKTLKTIRLSPDAAAFGRGALLKAAPPPPRSARPQCAVAYPYGK